MDAGADEVVCMSAVRDAEIQVWFADGRSERVSLAGRTQLVIGRGVGAD